MLIKLEISIHVDNFDSDDAVKLKNRLYLDADRLLKHLTLLKYDPVLSDIRTSILL